MWMYIDKFILIVVHVFKNESVCAESVIVNAKSYIK
jgi:hypothetical protein